MFSFRMQICTSRLPYCLIPLINLVFFCVSINSTSKCLVSGCQPVTAGDCQQIWFFNCSNYSCLFGVLFSSLTSKCLDPLYWKDYFRLILFIQCLASLTLHQKLPNAALSSLLAGNCHHIRLPRIRGLQSADKIRNIHDIKTQNFMTNLFDNRKISFERLQSLCLIFCSCRIFEC